jgi:hypothetical protein
MTALLPLLFLVQQSGAVRAPDPLDIVRKSVERDQSDWRRAKDYTYIERQEERRGAKVSSKTLEVTTLYGHEFRRLIARDGKPLPPGEAVRERERWDNAVAERASESDEKRARREAAAEEKRRKERAFVREIPDAYRFTLLGEDRVDGYETWVISATPREDFQPKDSRARELPKVRAKVWIAEKDYVWVKAEINVIHPLRWGLFVASLNPGTVIEFVQMRVNNEIWMPKEIHVHLNARLLFRKVEGEYNNSFSGYRKFRTDSRVLPSTPP